MNSSNLPIGYNVSTVMSKVLQALDMTVTEFSEAVGVSYGRISDVLRGRTKKLTPVLVNTICDALPQINKGFLYTGEGDVLIDGYVSTTTFANSKDPVVNRKVNDLLRLQQQLINLQATLLKKLDEVSSREVSVTQRECNVKIRELKVIEKEAKLQMKNNL